MELTSYSNKDVVLVRCIFKKENKNKIIGVTYEGKKYVIMKNAVSSKFKIGYDDTFYAIKMKEGLVLKTEVLYPITLEEYINLV